LDEASNRVTMPASAACSSISAAASGFSAHNIFKDLKMNELGPQPEVGQYQAVKLFIGQH